MISVRVFWPGLFAGLLQTAAIVPVDLLKIRMQLQRASSGSAAYVGAVQQLRQVLASQGLPGPYQEHTHSLGLQHWSCVLELVNHPRL